MYTQLSGSDIELLTAGDRQLSSFQLEGKSEQIVTTASSNICPPPTDSNWVFTGDAYVDEDGNIQLPTLGDTAYITLPWGKRANTLYVGYTLLFGSGLYLSVGYLDDKKNMISGNGYAVVDKEDNYSSSTNFGGTNEYGDALASATYITLTFMRGDVYGNNPYAVTNLSISVSDQEYTPFVPAIPSSRYPSEIKSVGYENIFDHTLTHNLANGATRVNLNTGLRVTATEDGTYRYIRINLGSLEKLQGEYTISYDTIVSGSNVPGVILRKATEDASSYVTLSSSPYVGSNTFRFTVPAPDETYTHLYIYFYVNVDGTGLIGDYAEYTNIIITKGIEKHKYIPHGVYGVEVKTRQENMFDSENWYETLHAVAPTSMNKEIVDGIEYYKVAPGNIYKYPYMGGMFKENTQYIIMCKARQYNQTENLGTGFRIHYTDDTYSYVYVNLTLEEYDYIIKTEANKTVSSIELAYAYNQYALIRNIMMVEGTEVPDYKPYQSDVTLFVLNEPLRSLPSGYFDTLHILSNKTYVYRQTGSVIFNGTEDWQVHDTAPHTFKLAMGTTIGKHGGGRCTHFKSITSSQFGLQDGIYDTYTNSVYITHMDSITIDDFKTWLSDNNVRLDYELLDPYTEELNPFDEPITFEGTNYITTTDELKPNMILEYFKGFSDEDKQAIKDSTVAVESKIIVKATDTLPEIVLTDNDSIKDWEYSDERYVPQQGFIGQFVARTLSGNLQDISDDFNIENREIELQLGIVHLGTDKTSWYTFGNFIVTNPEGDEVTDNTKFEAMDYTKRFNTEFNGNFTNDIFDKSYNSIVLVDETTGEPQGSVTALWLARYTCAQAGVEFGQNSFTNSDYVIDFNPYQAGETCRDVMKDIAKLAFSWVRVDVDNKCYIDFNESNTIENEYNTLTNNEYYSLETKKEVYGPINRVYIGMSNIDGESILVAEDKDDVATNGKKELYIYDNQLTYSPELRALIADNHSADKLLGLTYAHLTTETIGHPWLLGKEFITILDMEDNECKTYPFNRILKFNGHIKSTIDSMGESEVEATLGYESDVVKNAKNAMVLVKKHEAEIELVATDVTTVQTNLKENYYSKEETNQTIIDTASGLTNKYITAGGNNRFRNTGLYFKDGSDFEYWDGTVDVTTELESATQTAMLLQEGDVSQLVSGLPNNTYTVSFKYKKLIEGSSAYVILNQTKFDLGSEGTFEQVLEVNSNNIEILFHCDTDGGYEIYELMGNVGETALVWTQHPDEISTDTVSISKGITITSSTTDAVFKADADGIRIENKSKNTTTEFLDNGMSTNDAEIKGQAKVSGALFTKVGNQTWISGI